MQNSLLHTLVNGLDGSLVSAVGLLAVAGCHGGFKLLQSGLQRGFVGLVLLVGALDNATLFFADLMLGTGYTSSHRVCIEPANGQSHAEIYYNGPDAQNQ